MEICIVINLFQQPFRYRREVDKEFEDADAVNKHGNRILFVMEAGIMGVNSFIQQLPRLNVDMFKTLHQNQETGLQQAYEMNTQLLTQLSNEADRVKIIVTGHGEKGVPFIFGDGGELVDTWILFKAILELLTNPINEGGFGIRDGQKTRFQISLPICYGAHGTYRQTNDSVCYELARYFMHRPIAEVVRRITTRSVRIVGVQNVTYGIASRGFPERTDELQKRIDQELLRYTTPMLSGNTLMRGGEYTGAKYVKVKDPDGTQHIRSSIDHSVKSFKENQTAIGIRNRVRDTITNQVPQQDREFGKGEGNKVIIFIQYTPHLNNYQLTIMHKYTQSIMKPSTLHPIIIPDVVKFQRFRPGYRR